jgi:hypothetical protein
VGPVVAASLLLAQAPQPAEADRQAVLALAQAFFDALAARDGAALRKLCLPEARIQSIRPAQGSAAVRSRSLEELLEALASSREPQLERMWSPTVHLQGRIAIVWTPYDFHRNGTFSHSGTDTFTFLKTDQGWRIAALAYTVEPDRPSAHPAGPPEPRKGGLGHQP